MSATVAAAQRARQLLLEVYKSSTTPSATSLPSLVNELAKNDASSEEALFGAAQADVGTKKEVESWLGNIESEDKEVTDLKSLDQVLQSRTYLTNSVNPTSADVALLASLYPTVSTLPSSQQYQTPSICRYISHLSHVYEGKADIKKWEPEYEGMPAVERIDLAAQAKEKKEKKAAAAAGGSASTEASGSKAAPVKKQGKSTDAAATSSEGQPQPSKKEKKEKAAAAGGADGSTKPPKKEKPAKGGGGGAAAAADAGPPLPSMIDLRVGKIVDIEKHPDADSLYLEKVDFGEPSGPRVVLSGLVNYVPLSEMQNRRVVGICNLKPVAMRGIKSYAMLLCATAKEGKEGGVEPIYPPEEAEIGERIEVEGYEGLEPLEQLNPKKKIFEAIQPAYITTDSKEAAWVGKGPGDAEGVEGKPRLLKTAKGGVCYTKTFVGASLS